MSTCTEILKEAKGGLDKPTKNHSNQIMWEFSQPFMLPPIGASGRDLSGCPSIYLAVTNHFLLPLIQLVPHFSALVFFPSSPLSSLLDISVVC